MNTPTLSRSAALRLATLLAFPFCVSAQGVIRCKVDERVVFQSTPCAVTARASTQPTEAASAPANAASGPKKKRTLADLLRARDGADRGRSPQRDFQGDGSTVLRSRMGAV